MLTRRIPKGLLRRLVAGATFSALSVQLLYSLNPQIEISFLKLMLVSAAYGVAGGLLIGFALWLGRLVRKRVLPPRELRPHGFGFIVVAAAYCTVIFFMHRLTLQIYLPKDAVTQLSRSAGFVGLLTIALFILWLLERNAVGWRKQIVFGTALALIAICFVALSWKRTLLDPGESPGPSSASMPGAFDRPLVVVAVRYLPYDWIVQLEGEGEIPYFTEAGPRGFRARIEPFPTTSRRAIWASLLTGKLPYQHGVTGVWAYRVPWESEPFRIIPSGLGFRTWGLAPGRRTSLGSPFGRSRPFWSVLEASGVKVLHAGTLRGLALSEESSPGVEEARERLRSRGEEGRVALRHLEDDLARLRAVRESGAFVRVVEADALGRIRETLGGGNLLEAEGTERGEIFRDSVHLLGEALLDVRRRVPEATFVVVSPSAFQPHFTPDDLASYFRSRVRAETGDADGFLMIEGPGIRSGAMGPLPVGVTDVVPTLFFASGWPVARDLDGRVIFEMFREEFLRDHPLELVPSWDFRRRRSG